MQGQDFFEKDIEDFSESFTDILSSNIIHDQYQFESKFDFDLKPHADENEKNYHIDVYFFVPKNMGINSDTYTRENFYTDLTNYLRIQTPELFKWHKTSQNEWYLPIAEQYFAVHLSTENRQRLLGSVAQEIKLFACFVDTQLKQLQKLFIRILDRNYITRPNWIEAILQRIKIIMEIISVYRTKYLAPIHKNLVYLDSEVKKAFLLTDEFLSYRVEIILIGIMRAMEKYNIFCPDVSTIVADVLTKESSYRKIYKIANLDWASNTAQETYYYRLGLLKKYVQEVLYLQSKNIKKERTYRNLIAAAGAALAALWAGWADIQRFQVINPNHVQGAWVKLATLLFLGAIAYVFKDRIKELSKEYFNQRLKQYLPDFDILMFYKYFQEDGSEQQKFVGSCKEFFRYLQKKSLPPEISYIRDLGNSSELDPARDEVIMHYSKKITLVVQKTLSNIQFIRDMVRFDFTEFLNKLDDPNKVMSYFDPNSPTGIVTVEAPKVYHINVILRYSCSYQKDKKNSEFHIEYERLRIILNKKGILRIEPVLPRGALNYSGSKL